jgi:hypothetical protein
MNSVTLQQYKLQLFFSESTVGDQATNLSLTLMRLCCSMAECFEHGVFGIWSVPSLPLQLPPFVSTLTVGSSIPKKANLKSSKTM